MQVVSVNDYIRAANFNRESFGEILWDYANGDIDSAGLSKALSEEYDVPIEAAAVSFFHKGWQ